MEEKVSLSDRFGLWLGFHKCSQDDYLAMIDGYASHFGLEGEREALHAEALTWATTRGGRSGRVAWQVCAGSGWPPAPASEALGNAFGQTEVHEKTAGNPGFRPSSVRSVHQDLDQLLR